MTDQADKPDHDLSPWRDYLYMLAHVHVEPRLRRKVDLSGVVQQTLLEAYQGWPRLTDQSSAHKAAWLRRVLANNLADELRKLATGKRDLARERSLEAALEKSSARLETWLVADQSSPSQQAQRNEQALALSTALAELPEAQREALILQHWHGWSMLEIAEHLGRSRAAVAGLIKRGLGQLRGRLQQSE